MSQALTFREMRALAVLARCEKRRAWLAARKPQKAKSVRYARKLADEGMGWEDLVAECWIPERKARALVRNSRALLTNRGTA